MSAVDCPYCGAQLDDATHIEGKDMAPRDGDVSLCMHCAAISLFTGNGMDKRTPTSDEFVELLADPRIAQALYALASVKSSQ